jgi:alpha-L-fucosidase 2
LHPSQSPAKPKRLTLSQGIGTPPLPEKGGGQTAKGLTNLWSRKKITKRVHADSRCIPQNGDKIAVSEVADFNDMRMNSFPLVLILLSFAATAIAAPSDGNPFIAGNDVTWTTLGNNENDSMPIGNGDLAANVWIEQNGDIVLLIAKSDAWSEDGELLKLGRVRISLEPNPFVNSASFTQTLRLETGDVELHSGNNFARIWVDANNPVVHVQVQTEAPVELKATAEVWRTNEYHLDSRAIDRTGLGFFEWGTDPDGLTFYPDTILQSKDNRVSWCHFNMHSIYPLVFQKEHLETLLSKYPDPLMHRCFGITMKGDNLISSDDQTLKSLKASTSQQLDIYALTEQTKSPEAWRADLAKSIKKIDAIETSKAWKAHEQWWKQFWNRSWINVTGTLDAEKVTQSYVMQRFMTACAGRGAQPIKFNGSLFTVGHDLPPGTVPTEANHDPDYRAWGACFWNQDTRLIYYPLIATGDYDLLKPWFDMYLEALPLEKARTWTYYHHGGASFPETMYFWGLPNLHDFGFNNPTAELQSPWVRYHIQGALEIISQMLDVYDNSQHPRYATELVPFADAIITYYADHWPRDPNGKIHMAPVQSLETYEVDAVNPTPDIAGLKSVIPRLLALPEKFTSSEQRNFWTQTLNDLPPIPMGKTAHGKLPPDGVGDADGRPTILPAEKYGTPRNSENPELYVVYPYRLYGVGKPDLQLARDTLYARRFPMDRGWGQDGTQAAVLGLTDEARKVVVSEFTAYGRQRFCWFWDPECGGSGMITLQNMLMQCDGKRILLLPAWPADWTADFKLHAPYQTTVEGHVEHGKIKNLQVTPKSRAKDVIVEPVGGS